MRNANYNISFRLHTYHSQFSESCTLASQTQTETVEQQPPLRRRVTSDWDPIFRYFDTGDDDDTAGTDATTTERRRRPFFHNAPKAESTFFVSLLNAVAILWGTQHAVIKTIVTDELSTSSVASFTFCRFFVAAFLSLGQHACPTKRTMRRLVSIFGVMTTAAAESCASASSSDRCCLPITASVGGDNDKDYRKSRRDSFVCCLRWGIEMGIWMFLGYALQGNGLKYTTAQRSGFILYLNVKFVPLFARLFLGREISAATWISAIIAIIGTCLITYDGSPLNIGDLWSIAAAAASAMFILRLEQAASINCGNAVLLNSTCLWTVTAAAAIWTVRESSMAVTEAGDIPLVFPARVSPVSILLASVRKNMKGHPYAMLYLSGVTTTLANYLQTVAQGRVTAERASVIYAMDPVYGAIFAYLMLGETLGFQGLVGGLLVLIAAVANSCIDFTRFVRK